MEAAAEVPSLDYFLDAQREGLGPRPSNEQLEDMLVELESRWIVHLNDPGARVALALERFDLEADAAYTLQDIDAAYKKQLSAMITVYAWFFREELIGEQPRAGPEIRPRIEHIFESACSLRDLLRAELRHRLACGDAARGREPPKDISLFRFSFIDYKDLTKWQSLLLYLLRTASKRGYRRHRDACYEEIFVDGRPTRAWRRVCDIQEFIYLAITKEDHWVQWKNLTSSKDNARSACEYLKHANDNEFPLLTPDRRVFAFRNGLYVAGDVEACERSEDGMQIGSGRDDTFYPYTGEVPPKVACKYFDLEFDPAWHAHEDWYDIPSPNFHSILTYQELSDEVCRWIYAMVGRLIYEVNERDCWQCLMMVKGTAGTGKSTILKCARDFYDASDVAVLGNNIEGTFGLSAIYDKFAFFCYEMKQNFKLQMSDMQSLISGEEVSIPRKFRDAITYLWKAPGMMCGNETAGWVDVAGSITRRFLMVEFPRKVRNGDPQLSAKIQKELPALIMKCNCAYLSAVDQFSSEEIWKVLPTYFIRTQRHMRRATNALVAFLDSCDYLRFSPDYYMPFRKFSELYRDYCVGNGFGRTRLTMDHFSDVFAERGFRVVSEARVWDAAMAEQRYLIGVGLRDDIPRE